MDTELLTVSAMELARRIRAREVSPVEVVDAHIRRIERVNPALNAVVFHCFDRARKEARAAEERVMHASPPPLLGVPFTVKEMAGLEGCPHSAGSFHRRHAIAKKDGTAVARMRARGAIALGVTNQPEMGLWVESDNVVYGKARNPWDPSRSPGGSSGGEGAIIGAGGSAFGIGSDAGGSIRMPAFFCGIAGHNPTGAIVPLTGHFPFVEEPHPHHGPPPRQVVVGPMARTAHDLFPLLSMMAGPDGVDPYVQESSVTLGDPADRSMDVDFEGRTVLVLDDPRFRLASRADEAIRREVHSAAEVLRERGARVKPWSHPLLFDGLSIWRAAFAEGREHQSGTDAFAYGEELDLPREVLRHLFGRPRHPVSTLGFIAFERLMPRPRGTGKTARKRGAELLAALEEALGDGVLLMPPHPRTAPRHFGMMLRPLDWVYTALFNALETPATAVRTGQTRDGMPLGVQIVARRGLDRVSIAAGVMIEDALGGFRLPD
jgi:fatty acid amide hydrolase 2